MSLTLKQLSQLVVKLHDKAKEPNEESIDWREASHYIKAETAAIMRNSFYEFYTPETRTMPAHYKVTYEDVKIKEDRRGRNYAERPARYIAAPNNMGVVEVVPVSKKDIEVDPMIITSREQMNVVKRLEAGSVELEWTVYPERDIFMFGKKSRKTLLEHGFTAVDITLLSIEPEKMDDNDPYILPEEYQNEVILKVYNIMNAARAGSLSMRDIEDIRNNLEEVNNENTTGVR